MRDYDYRLPRRLHVAYDRKQLFGLLRSKNGGRLVENQYLGASVKRLDYLERLLLRDGHIVDLLIGIDVKTVFLADIADTLRGGLEIEAAFFFQSEHDVLRRRENVDEFEVLVYHADTQLVSVVRALYRNVPASDVDLSGIGIVDARKHIQQRGLSASVLSEERKDFTVENVHRDIVVCEHFVSEALCYPF